MIVLDTHVLIWTVQGNAKLGRKSAAMIEEAAQTSSILIPAICAWEAYNAEARGAIVLPEGAERWMGRVLERRGFIVAVLDAEIALATAAMDWSHRDPADRMIVATAIKYGMPRVTADEKILAYAAVGHVEAIDARH